MRVRVIGWYHSHPHITVLPSHVDVATQASYQQLDAGFIGIIFSTFNQVRHPAPHCSPHDLIVHLIDLHQPLPASLQVYRDIAVAALPGSACLSSQIQMLFASAQAHAVQAPPQCRVSFDAQMRSEWPDKDSLRDNGLALAGQRGVPAAGAGDGLPVGAAGEWDSEPACIRHPGLSHGSGPGCLCCRWALSGVLHASLTAAC